jgi:hypothetical protein
MCRLRVFYLFCLFAHSAFYFLLRLVFTKCLYLLKYLLTGTNIQTFLDYPNIFGKNIFFTIHTDTNYASTNREDRTVDET